MLSEPIRQRIVEKYEQLNRDGQLLTHSQLDQYYTTFRQKFGPQALGLLDGEALLETMHGVGTGNRDSLVYWLEFKNDDEFRTEFLAASRAAVH
jgi:5-methylcytosine-specific restriction protein B